MWNDGVKYINCGLPKWQVILHYCHQRLITVYAHINMIEVEVWGSLWVHHNRSYAYPSEVKCICMLSTSKSQASRTCLLPNGKLTTISLRWVGAPHFPCRRSHGWGPTGRTRNIYRVGVVYTHRLTIRVCSTYSPANPHSLYTKHNSVYPWRYLRICCFGGRYFGGV